MSEEEKELYSRYWSCIDTICLHRIIMKMQDSSPETELKIRFEIGREAEELSDIVQEYKTKFANKEDTEDMTDDDDARIDQADNIIRSRLVVARTIDHLQAHILATQTQVADYFERMEVLKKDLGNYLEMMDQTKSLIQTKVEALTEHLVKLADTASLLVSPEGGK